MSIDITAPVYLLSAFLRTSVCSLPALELYKLSLPSADEAKHHRLYRQAK